MKKTYEVTYSVVVTVETDNSDQAKIEAYSTLDSALDGMFMSFDSVEEVTA